MNVVDVDAGLEKSPPEDDQAIDVPIPATIAFKLITSPIQAEKSAIGSIVGAGLITTVNVFGNAH